MSTICCSEQPLKIPSTDGIVLDARLTHTAGPSKGIIMISHGITSNKEEGGLFTQLAIQLAQAGYDSLRFDFRGHGQSSGRPVDMTIRGETDDLTAVIAYARSQTAAPLGLVAASFGTVSTMNLIQAQCGACALVL